MQPLAMSMIASAVGYAWWLSVAGSVSSVNYQSPSLHPALVQVYSLQDIYHQHEQSASGNDDEQQDPTQVQQQPCDMSAAVPAGVYTTQHQSSCTCPPAIAVTAAVLASPSVTATAAVSTGMLGGKGCSTATGGSNSMEVVPSLGAAVAAC
jgi:hypothetical protein